DLFAIAQSFEGGPHGDLGLAKTYVAAEEAVHWLRTLHVGLDLCDSIGLVFSRCIFESVFELTLPIAVRRKSESLAHTAARVEFQQLIRHVAHLGFDARFSLLPRRATQAIEMRFCITGAAIFLYQVQARERNV